MGPIRLVFIFAFCLFLRVSIAAGSTDPTAAVDGDETVAVEKESLDDSGEGSVTPSKTVFIAKPATATSITVADTSTSSSVESSTEGAVLVLGTRQRSSEPRSRISLIPMAGASLYSSPWRSNISNSYVAGLAIDFPLSGSLSVEAEGNYGDYRVSYQTPFSPAPYGHDFSVWSVGGNMKVTLLQSAIRPYLGGGMMGLYYDGMTYGPPAPFRFSRWVGAAQAMGGVDVAVLENVAIGARAAWVHPLFNKLGPADRPYYSPEAGALSSSFWRFMGTVRVAL